MSANLAAILYMVSGILFIMALRGLSSPETSRQGNYLGMAGMAINWRVSGHRNQPRSSRVDKAMAPDVVELVWPRRSRS